MTMAERELRNREIHSLWSDIQEIIGPARRWPFQIRRLFWTRNLDHFQRILVCTFCFVNGLNPVVFKEWASLMHLRRDRAAESHIAALFNLFEGGNYYRLYSYNVTMNQYEYLDGTPRRYVPRAQRQNGEYLRNKCNFRVRVSYF